VSPAVHPASTRTRNAVKNETVEPSMESRSPQSARPRLQVATACCRYIQTVADAFFSSADESVVCYSSVLNYPVTGCGRRRSFRLHSKSDHGVRGTMRTSRSGVHGLSTRPLRARAMTARWTYTDPSSDNFRVNG